MFLKYIHRAAASLDTTSIEAGKEKMMIDWKGGYILSSDLEDKYVGGADSDRYAHPRFTQFILMDVL